MIRFVNNRHTNTSARSNARRSKRIFLAALVLAVIVGHLPAHSGAAPAAGQDPAARHDAPLPATGPMPGNEAISVLTITHTGGARYIRLNGPKSHAAQASAVSGTTTTDTDDSGSRAWAVTAGKLLLFAALMGMFYVAARKMLRSF